MFVLVEFLKAFTWLLNWAINALIVVIIVRALLSWVNADPYNALVRAIHVISEPFLKPFRRLLPPWKLNGIDLSPVFAILALVFLKIFLVGSLSDLIQHLMFSQP
jgi:YggT family protein